MHPSRASPSMQHALQPSRVSPSQEYVLQPSRAHTFTQHVYMFRSSASHAPPYLHTTCICVMLLAQSGIPLHTTYSQHCMLCSAAQSCMHTSPLTLRMICRHAAHQSCIHTYSFITYAALCSAAYSCAPLHTTRSAAQSIAQSCIHPFTQHVLSAPPSRSVFAASIMFYSLSTIRSPSYIPSLHSMFCSPVIAHSLRANPNSHIMLLYSPISCILFVHAPS
jgi:hypothetical protein